MAETRQYQAKTTAYKDQNTTKNTLMIRMGVGEGEGMIKQCG